METPGQGPPEPLRQIEHLADADAPVRLGAPGIPSGAGLGKYRILERIRTYHNAAVYKARDTMLDRLVAIKQMSPGLIDSPVACGNFKREAQLLARIPKDTRHVLNVHELIEDEIGLFIVEEFINGFWLESLIFKRQVDHKSAYKLLRTAGIGLRALHENMIVHRDIHPGNIMVARSNAAKIANLGSAAHEGDLTPPPVITPKYAAPELLLDRKYDCRVDIYSLGLVLYEVCVGRPALEQHFKDMLAEPMASVGAWIAWHTNFDEHLPDAAALNPLVPPAMSDILRKMTAKDLNVRYTSIAEMLDDLNRAFAPRLTDRPEPQTREPLALSTGYVPAAEPRYLPEPPSYRSAEDRDAPPQHDPYTRSAPRRPPTSTHTVRPARAAPADDSMYRWQAPGAESWPAARGPGPKRPSRPRPAAPMAPPHVITLPPPPPARAEIVRRKHHGHALRRALACLLIVAALGGSSWTIWYFQFGPGATHPINAVATEAIKAYDTGRYDDCLSLIREAKRMNVSRSDLVALQGRLDFWADLVHAQQALEQNQFATVEKILYEAGQRGVNPSKVDEIQQKLWSKRDAMRLAAEGMSELADGRFDAVESKLDEYADRAKVAGLDPQRLQDNLNVARADSRYDQSINEAQRFLAKNDFESALTACENAEAVRVTSTTRELRLKIENGKKRRNWVARGDQSMLQKDFVDAEASYTEAIRLGPSPELEMKTRYARAYLLMQEARDLIARGELLDAEQKLKSSLWNAFTQEARSLLEHMSSAFNAARIVRAAERALERGEDAEALKLFDQALPQLPDPAKDRVQKRRDATQRHLLIKKGDDARNRGDTAAAVEAYHAARDIRPGPDIDVKLRLISSQSQPSPPETPTTAP